MNKTHSDLIAIANADLAEKLNRRENKNIKSINSAAPKADSDEPNSFKQDIWKAVYTLNLIRYLLGVVLLVIAVAYQLGFNWRIIDSLIHPQLFLSSTVLLLFSAIAFSYLSRYQDIEFNVLVTLQFSLDVVLASLLTHSTGSIDSNFSMLYLLVAATGSVVLPRKQALGLASGTIILLFFEHFYSIWSGHLAIKPDFPLLARYGLILLCASLLIAYLAERIRIAELKRFVPGDETIEEFLVREEVNALTTALQRTDGNKTEAAKLLGMTFRSFRYKLTKYDIG